MADQFTPIPVKGLKTNNAATPDNEFVASLSAIVASALPTLTNGNVVALYVGTNGRLYTSSNLQVGGTDVSAASPVPISATAAANAANNPIFTRLTDGTAPVGTVGNPLYTTATSASDIENTFDQTFTSVSVAAGASVDFNGTAIAVGKDGYAVGMTASASVRLKVELKKLSNTSVVTTVRVFFVEAYQYLAFKAALDDAIGLLVADGTNAKFRITVTNKDNASAADVYASLTYNQHG